MNRKQRRANKKPQKSPADFFKAGRLALGQKNYNQALGFYAAAVERDRTNHLYKLHLCSLLQNLEFKQFNPKAKSIILTCLMARGLNYQDLSQAWFSILICDPDMAALQNIINGGDVEAQNLTPCLKDPYLLEGLTRLIVINADFENALGKIKKDIDAGAPYPKSFVKALNAYALNTEYAFCPIPEDGLGYKIDQSIETLSAPDDKISKAVRAQYEENPYPRWISCNVQNIPKDPTKKPYKHLIAGCGTGYATCMTGMFYPEATITAFDLSLASLSYAKKKAREFGLSNINFYQADILKLDGLDQKFDVIECSGVLHHMHDPEKGWRCLMDKLAPDGKMHIGLYSEVGRTDVVAARQLIEEKKFKPTHDGIQKARQEIINLPADHPARGVINRRDFYSTSSCRDLIFHIQEHRFTIEKLSQTFKNLGLKFIGFNFENRRILEQYLQEFPEDAKASNLKNWKTFEEKNPESFKGMYQFWCERK